MARDSINVVTSSAAGVELTKTTGAVVTDLVDGVFGVKASPVHA